MHRVYLVLIVFCALWTKPIDQINNLILQPTLVADTFNVSYNTAVRYMSTFSGLTQSILFSICPIIFRFLSCIEGSSISMEQAEQKSMIYFWYFYIIARFLGPVLLNATQSFKQSDNGTIEEIVTETVAKLASEIPDSLGPSALTYILFSCLLNWPANYLLQSMNFITKFFRMKWLNNYVLKGGGIGRDVPYRIYVDSGYIFACLISMAPMVPLLGPVCLLHFIIVSPILRWLLIFTYRPKFDSGGGTFERLWRYYFFASKIILYYLSICISLSHSHFYHSCLLKDKWPKLHHIIISSLLLGQFLTSLSFALKGNIVEGLSIGCCIIPTLIYNSTILSLFLKTYRDGGLVQAGRMHYGRRRSSRSISSEMEREGTKMMSSYIRTNCLNESSVTACLYSRNC